MTTTLNPTAPRTGVPLVPAAAATLVGTVAFTALGTVLSGPGDDHGWQELGIVAAIALAAIVGVMALVHRMQDSTKAGGVGLTLSIVALPTVLVFFMGVTPALAVGGLLLGAAARRSGRGAGLGVAATAIGALALLGYMAIYVSDFVA